MIGRFRSERYAIRQALCYLLLIVWQPINAAAEATLPIQTQLEKARSPF